MKKTSVYLTSAERNRLAWLAEREATSQADIIRRAIAVYSPEQPADRNFRMAGIIHEPGVSVADIPEERLLEGFGDDAFGE